MPKTVLTIDDDTAITELLAMLLRTHGFEVVTANTGEEGIKAIDDTKPHVNVPIVILSALDDPAMIASALDAGADDYLVKPVSSSILVAHLNRLIRRTGNIEAPSRVVVQHSNTQPLAS